MAYVWFFLFLLVAGLLIAGLSALKDLFIFRRVFGVLASILATLPIALWAPAILVGTLLIYPVIGFLVFILGIGLVNQASHIVGFVPTAQSPAIVGLLPQWGWYLIGSGVTGSVVWLFNRSNRFGHD